MSTAPATSELAEPGWRPLYDGDADRRAVPRLPAPRLFDHPVEPLEDLRLPDLTPETSLSDVVAWCFRPDDAPWRDEGTRAVPRC